MSPSENGSPQAPGNPGDGAADRFNLALQRLMSRAPGPVFPRARRLYFDKYPLEGAEATTTHRTHLLEEVITENSDGSLSIAVQSFALVPWDPEPGMTTAVGLPEVDAGERYLWEQWRRRPTGITPMQGPWFRTETAYLRVEVSATYRSGGDWGSSLMRAGS